MCRIQSVLQYGIATDKYLCRHTTLSAYHKPNEPFMMLVRNLSSRTLTISYVYRYQSPLKKCMLLFLYYWKSKCRSPTIIWMPWWIHSMWVRFCVKHERISRRKILDVLVWCVEDEGSVHLASFDILKLFEEEQDPLSHWCEAATFV